MEKEKGRALKIWAIIILFVIIVWTVLYILPRPKNFSGDNPMMKAGELPILIAHGGGNKEFPDNTLEAFYNAYSVDERVMMETDVSLTKDGILILSHDTTLDRKTNVTGNISDWNYSDLIEERVNFGYTNNTEDGVLVEGSERALFKNEEGREVTPLDVEYPDGVTARDSEIFLATTLEELMIAFPENAINVEVKQSGELGEKAAEEALRLIEKYDASGRVVLASFHDEMYSLYREWQKEGKTPEGFMYSPGIGGVIKFFALYITGLDIFFFDGMCVFQLPTEEYGINLADESLVNTAHRHNLAVHYWTINDREEMKKLIEIGADGIMTDYPHRLKEVYNSVELEAK